MNKIPSYIIISRTDSIGDVMLTLPVAKILKDNFPGVGIGFLGKQYTRAVIDACVYIDDFIEVDDFMSKPLKREADAIIHVFPQKKVARRAKQLKIPLRIGTTNRIYHWFTCNRLVKLSRRKSDLHEAQLNLKLLQGLNITRDFSLEEISMSYGVERFQKLQANFSSLIDRNKYNVIIHPKSRGSSREWSIYNFITLINSLDHARYKIFVSGTTQERALMQPLFDAVANKISDITCVMDLAQFMAFINEADGLVANSTGPVHIAAALGKDALGIYPPRKSITPRRWKPLGPKAQYFVTDKKNCEDCEGRNSFCHCIQEITPSLIRAALDDRLNNFGI